MAIIGANTEPMRYRKSVISSIGYRIAAMVPTIVTITAMPLLEAPLQMVVLDTPAEYASIKVVVTVEKMITMRPARPRPAFIMMVMMESPPPKIAALRPKVYITILVTV